MWNDGSEWPSRNPNELIIPTPPSTRLSENFKKRYDRTCQKVYHKNT